MQLSLRSLWAGDGLVLHVNQPAPRLDVDTLFKSVVRFRIGLSRSRIGLDRRTEQHTVPQRIRAIPSPWVCNIGFESLITILS